LAPENFHVEVFLAVEMIIYSRHIAIGSLGDLSNADGVVTLLGKKVFCLF
jgi:hypothetical protein